MSWDWKKLSPHRPIDTQREQYVERPWDGGSRLADLVDKGLGPLFVAGPPGVGKSTELAAAARALQTGWVACFVRLDKVLDVGDIDGNRVRWELASRLYNLATTQLKLQISASSPNFFASFRPTSPDLVVTLLRDIAKLSRQTRVALLVDGLEKTRDTDNARATVESILSIVDRAGSANVQLILVVPPALAWGPSSDLLFGQGGRLHPIHPVPAIRQTNLGRFPYEDAKSFLQRVLDKRFDHPISALLAGIIDRAAEASGGIPRTFLQLIQDAAGYGAVGGRELPTPQDLRAAIRDHALSLERRLVEGDYALLVNSHGKELREVPIDKRIRFIAQGLLLEYEVAGGPDILLTHPLIIGKERLLEVA